MGRLYNGSTRVVARFLFGGVLVTVDVKDVLSAMHDMIDDMVDRGSAYYTEAVAEQDKIHHEREIRKNMEAHVERIKKAVQAIPNWHGSKVHVVARMTSDWLGKDNYMDANGESTHNADIQVYQSNPRMAPGFTIYKDGSIEDVLDVGDTDFFDSPELESDYFALVTELRHPGRAKQEAEKVVPLYTARPAKDRSRYENAKTIPSNVFLTTSLDEAEGYKVEFGGDRDVWKIWIKKKYLILTMDHGRLKNYQVFSSGGNVPIERIDFVG